MKEKLRIAILLDNDKIAAWSYKMISEIKSSLSCEIVLIINCKGKSSSKHPMFYTIFNKIDNKLFKPKWNALKTKSIDVLLGSNSEKGQSGPLKNIDNVSLESIDEIKEYDVDILINLGVEIPNEEVLNVLKYGIWSYNFGSNNNNGLIPVFWKVIKSVGEVGTTLNMKTKDRSDSVLYTTRTLIDNKRVLNNLNKIYCKIYDVIPRKIDELYSLGEEVFFEKVRQLNEHPKFYSTYKNEIPSNIKMVFLLMKNLTKRIGDYISNLIYFNQWILLFSLDKTSSISKNFNDFIKIIPPKDRIWVDPHVIKKNGNYYIFIEELIYKEDKGFISVIIMDEDGNYSNPVKIIETDYHLSYPFIIEDKGEIYMIPESKQKNNIQLFKCIEFPLKWELETVLIDNIPAVDSTVLYKNNKYWLFTNYVKNQGASSHDELFLYSSDNLVSDNWESHPENPIVSDVKNARPAGTIFEYNGSHYRSSQNCEKRYGYGVQINQILELSKTRYRERIINSIVPDWHSKIKGIHTICYHDGLTVIDARLKRMKTIF